MTDTSDPYDLGPSFMDGPQGPDRSLLAHCLNLVIKDTMTPHRGHWAVEFGTGTGETTRMIADVLPVISFDSFQGLPEDWRPGFRKGHFSMKPPEDIAGATIVPGWFSDTVPNYEWPTDIALVHFDADLYSSTSLVLEAIGPHLPIGCILVFDEFHGYDDDFHGVLPGEQQAWREFAAAHPLTWDVIGHGREQWAVRVRSLDA